MLCSFIIYLLNLFGKGWEGGKVVGKLLKSLKGAPNMQGVPLWDGTCSQPMDQVQELVNVISKQEILKMEGDHVQQALILSERASLTPVKHG